MFLRSWGFERSVSSSQSITDTYSVGFWSAHSIISINLCQIPHPKFNKPSSQFPSNLLDSQPYLKSTNPSQVTTRFLAALLKLLTSFFLCVLLSFSLSLCRLVQHVELFLRFAHTHFTSLSDSNQINHILTQFSRCHAMERENYLCEVIFVSPWTWKPMAGFKKWKKLTGARERRKKEWNINGKA